MPLPLGHAFIGVAANELCSDNNSIFRQWRIVIYTMVLANLPDLDVFIGLVFRGNGNAFHRGPTHSLLFALIMGYFASNLWKYWSQVPKISLRNSFLFIFSHVLADYFFTNSSVSFFWPFQVSWASGSCDWGDVINSVFLESFQDAWIIIACGAIITFNRLIKGKLGINRTIIFLRSAPIRWSAVRKKVSIIDRMKWSNFLN